MTAYTGLLNIGQRKLVRPWSLPLPQVRLVQVVGQITKLKGCRVVGIAGGPKKVRYLTEELGFDVGLGRGRRPCSWLKNWPVLKGIDIYFENVGGHVWDAVFPLLNDARAAYPCAD